MLPQFVFNETEMLVYALVLLRISAFLVSWPLFSVYSVPNQVKILLAVVLTTLLYSIINRSHLVDAGAGTGVGAGAGAGAGWSHDLAWLAGKEVLTGLCLGFMTRLFFFAVAIGGSFIATAAGMANGQMFNPAIGTNGSTVEQFYATLATLLFLALNGHHYLLTGLAQSFEAVPLSLSGTEFASLLVQFKDGGLILQTVTECGIKIAAPIMLTTFLLNVVMGILGRTVPQINVLVTSMPLNFMGALVVMIIAIPALLFELDHEVVNFAELVFKFMKRH